MAQAFQGNLQSRSKYFTWNLMEQIVSLPDIWILGLAHAWDTEPFKINLIICIKKEKGKKLVGLTSINGRLQKLNDTEFNTSGVK